MPNLRTTVRAPRGRGRGKQTVKATRTSPRTSPRKKAATLPLKKRARAPLPEQESDHADIHSDSPQSDPILGLDLPPQDHAETETETMVQSPAKRVAASGENSRTMPKVKKERLSYKLRTHEHEVNMMEFMREHPMLWNLKDKDYKCHNKKERLWEEKADELGYEGK